MSATVESLEMLAHGPARWFLSDQGAGASRPVLFTWTRDQTLATRFSDEEAERLISKDRRDQLPLLPTEPEKLPTFLRIVHGTAEDIPPPAFVINPAPAPKPTAKVDHIKAHKPKTKPHYHPTPAEVFEDLDKRHLA